MRREEPGGPAYFTGRDGAERERAQAIARDLATRSKIPEDFLFSAAAYCIRQGGKVTRDRVEHEARRRQALLERNLERNRQRFGEKAR